MFCTSHLATSNDPLPPFPPPSRNWTFLWRTLKCFTLQLQIQLPQIITLPPILAFSWTTFIFFSTSGLVAQITHPPYGTSHGELYSVATSVEGYRLIDTLDS